MVGLPEENKIIYVGFEVLTAVVMKVLSSGI
jgi:hypothetical protein